MDAEAQIECRNYNYFTGGGPLNNKYLEVWDEDNEVEQIERVSPSEVRTWSYCRKSRDSLVFCLVYIGEHTLQ